MSKTNLNIAKAITLLSEVISEEAAIAATREADAFDNEAEEEETVTVSEYVERCTESEDYSNDVTDALELLKEEIDQVFEDQSEDSNLDDEFSEPGWENADEDFDSETDAVEEKIDDDAVQEELPLGDTPSDGTTTDDESTTAVAFDEKTYNTMLTAYTELEIRKENLQRCLESTLESVTVILEDSESFRTDLDRNSLDLT